MLRNMVLSNGKDGGKKKVNPKQHTNRVSNLFKELLMNDCYVPL